MAQTNSASSKQMTAAEMQQWIKDHESALNNYAAALDPIKQLRDLTRISSTRRINSLTKENIITYLQNPLSNENNLRNAVWYIYYRSQIFQRIVLYFATLFCLDARSVIPKYDLVKPDSDEKILKSYNNTLKMLSNWNIEGEFLKTNVTCLIQDVSYNCAYYDKTGLYLLPLPANYCRIYGQYPTGDFSFAFDCSYFRGVNEWLVEAWGEPFRSMYRRYQTEGNAGRWQIMPDEYAACFKYRSYNWEDIIPPFSGILPDLINLNDVNDIAAVADRLDVYKLIYLKLKTITGSKVPDDYEVSPQVAVEYANRLIEEALPDYASFGIVPGTDDLGVIDFSNSDKASETNKVLKATKAVLNTSGGAQILNSAEITGTTAFMATIKADTEFAIATLLPQIGGWMNRILPYVVSNPSKVHFYHTGRLLRDEFRKELLENAQYSLPTKLAIMSLNGIDALDAMSLNHLEEDILKLGEKFDDPLKSSYTASNNEGGRPSSDDSDLTDEGDASRDKRDRQ